MVAGKRFRWPQIGFTLFCGAVACGCLGLSLWQHQRAQLKERLQNQAQQQAKAAPVELAVVASDAASSMVWRRATAVGVYASDQFLVDNRFNEHEVGFHVIAPLELENGNWLLVNRGWLKAAPQRSENRLPPVPQGTVTVSGTLVPDAAKAFELGKEETQAQIRQHLKIDRWQRETGRQALPLVLLNDAAQQGLVAVRAVSDFKAARSYGYRLQWLALAIVVVGGWFAVALRGRRDAQ